jgi:hypothetical protein
MKLRTAMIAAATFYAAGLPTGALAQQADMSFFVTSVAPEGKGGNLGGLAGADAYCQSLAQAVGAGNKTWRAYLSTNALATPPVAARERIGNGPWYNAKGAIIAFNVADLHGDIQRVLAPGAEALVAGEDHGACLVAPAD